MDLPAELKLADPMTYHMEPDEAPVLAMGDASVRVMVGRLQDVAGPVQPRTECGLWDVTVPGGTRLDLPLVTGWRAFGILTKGQIRGFDVPIQSAAAVRFRPDADRLTLQAGPEGARLVIFVGRLLHQPLAFAGPFVMSNEAQLVDAQRRFAAGQMGRLAQSF